VFRELGNIAKECLTEPRITSVWSPELGRYQADPTAAEETPGSRSTAATAPPPINSTFKFVFIWSFAGTLLFVGLCVVLSLVAGREPPPLFEKVIMATFDLAKIGFGAIVGLLGGKYAQGKPAGATQEEAGSTA
jgi:hypothetical protein